MATLSSTGSVTRLQSTLPTPSRRAARRALKASAGAGAALPVTAPAPLSPSPAPGTASPPPSTAGATADHSGIAAGKASKESTCIDILTSGHINAFVDFFYLSHRADPTADRREGDGPPADVRLSQDDMAFLRTTLCAAEDSRRSGQVPAVLDSYAGLAEHYADRKDSRTAVYFYEKCLEVAQGVGDAVAELHTLHNLGTVHEGSGDTEHAIAYFEAHRDAAAAHQEAAGGVDGATSVAALPFQAEVRRANTALVRAYGQRAKALDTAGDAQGALETRLQALAAASATGDAAAEAATSFHVGRTYVANAQPEQGIKHLQRYLDLSSDPVTAEGAGALGAQRAAAFAGLAAAFHAMGVTEKATACLQDFLAVSEEGGDLASQAHACASLGDIHNRRGQFKEAVKCFEKSYKLYRSLVLAGTSTRHASGEQADAGAPVSVHREVEHAKVHLGMARGNAAMGSYVNTIITDVSALLKWKNRRTVLKAPDIALAGKEGEL
ncbi:TTC29 [Symbiodinium sp. KB8]|nr:TTC29 [Symbiodinium sp. KB8]